MLTAAILLQAGAAIFAPPLEAPLRVTSERIQSGRRQYAMERFVRFVREPGGYRAEVWLEAASSDTLDGTGALYEAGFAALARRTIVFHLDGAGTVRAIDDLPALWEAFCAQVAQATARQRTLTPAAREALAARIAAPLRALPAQRQHALLASLVTAAIAGTAAEPPGVRHVRLPGSSPFGGQVTLAGTRTTTAAAGLLETATLASADVTVPAAAGAPARSGRIELEIRRRFDPRTGLILSASETNRTIVGGTVVERVATTRVTPADRRD